MWSQTLVISVLAASVCRLALAGVIDDCKATPKQTFWEKLKKHI